MGDGRYLNRTEGSGGSSDGPFQPRQSKDGVAMAHAGYKTVSMAEQPEDGLMTELADPFTDKTL
jgi:hypothetical protein